MFSVRQRLCDITTVTLVAVIFMAGLTAASSIIRDVLVRPRPVITALSISASPVFELRQPTVLPASGGQYRVKGKLDPSIEMIDGAEETYNLPPGLKVGIRNVDRLGIYVSAVADFSACWDWNTKAIYISVLARYRTYAATENEVIFADAILRRVTVPKELQPLQSLEVSEMTPDQQQQWLAFEKEVRHQQHDHASVHLDHVRHRVSFNHTLKYFVDDYAGHSLPGKEIEVVVRYQVMSYSGYAPVREDVVSGHAFFRAPEVSIPWRPQGSAPIPKEPQQTSTTSGEK